MSLRLIHHSDSEESDADEIPKRTVTRRDSFYYPKDSIISPEHLQSLKEAISTDAPYCSGTCPLPIDSFMLYYGTEETG
jgi:hypothetical protein